jgi:hypothetical protein
VKIKETFYIEGANMSTKKILLSLAVIGILVTVLIFVDGKKKFAPSKGTWFVAYPEATDNMTKISDEPYEFKLGDMSCGVTKTQFIRQSADSKASKEARELYCWVSEDTYVSTATNCDLPNYSAQGLTIKKKGQQLMPTLMCGPDKKRS